MEIAFTDYVQGIADATINCIFCCVLLKPRHSYLFTVFAWVFLNLFTYGLMGFYSTDTSLAWWQNKALVMNVLIFALVFLLFKDEVKKRFRIFLLLMITIYSVEVIGGAMILFFTGDILVNMTVENTSDFRLIAPIMQSVTSIIVLIIHNRYAHRKILPMIMIQLLLMFTEWSFLIVLYSQHSIYLKEYKLFMVLLFVFPAVAVNYLAAWTTTHMVSISRKEAELEFAQKLGSQEYEYYRTALENENKIRVLYHEVANQMQILEELLEQGSDEQAKSIAGDLIERYTSVHTIRFCDNRIINLILSVKEQEAEKRKCKFTAQAGSLPDKLKIKDTDMSVLLTNLIDGAIENAEKADDGEREITMKIGYVSGKFVATVESPCEAPDKRVMKKKGKLNDESGQKLVLVKKVLKSYDGELAASVQDGRIKITAAL